MLNGEKPASERGGLIRGAGRELASDVRRRLRPTDLCPVNNRDKRKTVTIITHKGTVRNANLLCKLQTPVLFSDTSSYISPSYSGRVCISVSVRVCVCVRV